MQNVSFILTPCTFYLAENFLQRCKEDDLSKLLKLNSCEQNTFDRYNNTCSKDNKISLKCRSFPVSVIVKTMACIAEHIPIPT